MDKRQQEYYDMGKAIQAAVTAFPGVNLDETVAAFKALQQPSDTFEQWAKAQQQKRDAERWRTDPLELMWIFKQPYHWAWGASRGLRAIALLLEEFAERYL